MTSYGVVLSGTPDAMPPGNARWFAPGNGIAFNDGGAGQAVTISARATVQNASPIAGATVNIATPNSILCLTPAGTIATLTVNAPGGARDGDMFRICCSQIVLALKMGGNGLTLVGALTSLILGGFGCWIKQGSFWMRCG